MQRNRSKLKNAEIRRVVSKAFLLISVVFMTIYLIFLVSEGNRNFADMGHLSLLVSTFLMLIAFFIMRPVYALEYPFLASRNK